MTLLLKKYSSLRLLNNRKRGETYLNSCKLARRLRNMCTCIEPCLRIGPREFPESWILSASHLYPSFQSISKFWVVGPTVWCAFFLYCLLYCLRSTTMSRILSLHSTFTFVSSNTLSKRHKNDSYYYASSAVVHQTATVDRIVFIIKYNV